MKKSVLRVIFLICTALLALFFLLRDRSPFGKDNTSFAVDSQRNITKIELSEGKDKLFLEKNGENWLLDDRYETRKSEVLFILRVLKEIKIKSPVSPEMFESDINSKGVDPVKVRVWEKRKLLRSFFVYKTRSNNYGNIMKMTGRSKPYIVYVPGNEGDIGSVFTINRLFWEPYSIFNLLPSEIASVDLENVADSTNSFRIYLSNHRFLLSGTRENLRGWDSSFVARYITYFTRIPFESWALDLDSTEQRSLEMKKPLYRLTVITTEGKQTVLKLWEKMKSPGEPGIIDTDRLYGKTAGRDEFFIIRYFDIDPLLKKRSYFFAR